MNTMKALLFGSVEKIVLHCAQTRAEEAIRTHIRPEFSETVPLRIEPPLLGMEYVQIHYSAGIFSEAHADIMVIN